MTIRLVNVSKSYVTMGKRKRVFSNINLTLARGRNIGLIGANGTGKSTLLRMIAGAEAPDTGYVSRDVRLSWPIGFSGAININLTGTANARFCARLYGRDAAQVAAETADFSGLGEFMHMPVKTYSTGMRAKLAFSISMAIDFECMLIDEVLGVGDTDFRAKCNAAIEERRATTSIILVTHNLKDVIRLCDQVVVLGGPQPIVSDDVAKTVKQYAITLSGVQEALEL